MSLLRWNGKGNDCRKYVVIIFTGYKLMTFMIGKTALFSRDVHKRGKIWKFLESCKAAEETNATIEDTVDHQRQKMRAMMMCAQYRNEREDQV